MKDNKLIAEFMGGYTPYERFGNNTEYYYRGKYVNLDDMKFNSSWNWLMPVVEKIEEDDEIDVNILLNGTRIFKWRTDTDIVNNVAQISFDKKIDHVYNAVVEFIKQYNKTNK